MPERIYSKMPEPKDTLKPIYDLTNALGEKEKREIKENHQKIESIRQKLGTQAQLPMTSVSMTNGEKDSELNQIKNFMTEAFKFYKGVHKGGDFPKKWLFPREFFVTPLPGGAYKIALTVQTKPTNDPRDSFTEKRLYMHFEWIKGYTERVLAQEENSNLKNKFDVHYDYNFFYDNPDSCTIYLVPKNNTIVDGPQLDK